MKISVYTGWLTLNLEQIFSVFELDEAYVRSYKQLIPYYPVLQEKCSSVSELANVF